MGLRLAAIFLAPAQGMSLSNETNFQYFLNLFSGRLSSAQAMVCLLFILGAGPLFAALIITSIVGWTIINTWLYNNTKSVWLMILLHGWGNAVQSYLVLSSNNMLAQTLYGILPWGLAIFLIRKFGQENLSPHPRLACG